MGLLVQLLGPLREPQMRTGRVPQIPEWGMFAGPFFPDRSGNLRSRTILH